jgi:hypothetical protein
VHDSSTARAATGDSNAGKPLGVSRRENKLEGTKLPARCWFGYVGAPGMVQFVTRPFARTLV